MSEIKPFMCDSLDKAVLRNEWEKWLRSFTLYLEAEEITAIPKKKSKLLHLGGPQLQEVAYNIPGALVEYDPKAKNDVFGILVQKLDEYFTPKRNSAYERHIFRSLSPAEGESFSKFMLKLRQQMSKCFLGSTKSEIEEISLKDKIIDSWASNELKKKLLEREMTLDEVIDICKIHEEINKSSQAMLVKNETEIVGKVEKKRFNSLQKSECSRCGHSDHDNNSKDCPARNSRCNKCFSMGHYARMCKSKFSKRKMDFKNERATKQRKFSPRVRNINDVLINNCDNDNDGIDCLKIDSDSENEETVLCNIGGTEVKMVIDSGSPANLLTENHWNAISSSGSVVWNVRSRSKNCFKAYASNQPLKILKVFEAPISINNEREIIGTFYVIENSSQSLLSRDTSIKLKVLKVGLEACRIEDVKPFSKLKNIKVKLSIDPKVIPVKQPLRRVPVALEEKVNAKLKDAICRDIIEPVNGPSQWISPIVIVFKGNGEIRLCIDMRQANKAILRENYPLPTFETFITKARGAKFFSRLDLKDAYHQIELDEASREITTFISHRGLFRYKRLMFGVNSAPEIFQRIIEGLLAPCKNSLNYLDDVIIFGETEIEHDEAVKRVLKIFTEYNVLLNKEKCVWKARRLKFLGHIMDEKGISADPEKVKLIMDFRRPTNKEEVRSFLGLVTYVGRFIPDLSHMTDSLRSLLKANTKYLWASEQEEAFKNLKTKLSQVPNLSYFNPQNRTRLIADASPVALGAVLIQFGCDNEPFIISFASKSLSEVERRYSQTEKESLALVWAVEKFYYYLAGLEFELVTDHKPLEAIFKPTSRPPARIERWLLRLQAYKFRVIYRPGKENIADSISRLCKIEKVDCFDGGSEQSICHIVSNAVPSAITIAEVATLSAQDNEIAGAITCLNNNTWRNDSSNCYYPFRHEFSGVGAILLRGTRIVIPRVLRERLLILAHEGHPGESAMKRRIRSKVWWPGIDREVEQFVKACRDCLIVSQPSKPPPMHRHAFPDGPWQCVATDLLGPLPNNEHVLVLIDYYSRYQEVKFLNSISSQAIIKAMKEIFCRLGLPKSLRTDNGRQFVSTEFKNYCANNNIELITTPPYWPQANGEVENMNRSLVKRLKIASVNKSNFREEIQKFIFSYNVTPHGTTGSPPTELMFNRLIRDKIPDVRDLTENVIDSSARDLDQIRKQKGKELADKKRGAREPEIMVGDRVLLKNVVFPSKLTPTYDLTEYEVIEINGSEVKLLGNGKIVKRNITHCKKIIMPKSQLVQTSIDEESQEEKQTVTLNSDDSEAQTASS